MADFPRVPVHMASVENILDVAMVSRSRAGRVRVRRLYPNAQVQYLVALRGLTDAQRDSVDQFLALNRSVPFNFYWPRKAVTRQVVWIDSGINWKDDGAKLSSTDLTFAVSQ